MAQQTAVEWLEQEIEKKLPFALGEIMIDLFEQAKKMEREQMEKAFIQPLFIDCPTFDKYYTKTYSTRLQNETN
jgi:hypothetical protein